MENSGSNSAGAPWLDGVDKDAGTNRRETGRFRTVCRIARVTRADDVGLWRVRNISNQGMMLAADVRATTGEVLVIALSETVSISATVAWAERGRCGVAFDAPIDAAAVLRGLADEQRTEGYRALRLPVEIEAIVALRNDARPIDLVDISQHGAGFRFDGALEPGTEVDLILPGGELRRRALVRWSQDRRGGLWFTQQLDRAALESIALLRQ